MKIGFCGTMSVGKTTIVNELKDLPEFKDYNFRTERSKYLMEQGIPLNTDSTLKGQTIFLAERSGEFLSISSASLSINKGNFESLAACLVHEYDHIFYISPNGVKIEDNGVRETDSEYRKRIDQTIQHYLSKYGYRIKNLTYLSGSTGERIEKIKQTVFS